MEERINIEIKKQTENINKAMELFSLPLNSRYYCLSFTGLTDGINELVPQFDINQIVGKMVTIKSFKIVPYYPPGLLMARDINFSDGTTEDLDGVQGLRVNRLFDDVLSGTGIQFMINGSPVLFNAINNLAYPLDLFVDNIYYQYPAKIETMTITINSRMMVDLLNLTMATASVKVLVECYIS
jgi:hypothetical protein